MPKLCFRASITIGVLVSALLMPAVAGTTAPPPPDARWEVVAKESPVPLTAAPNAINVTGLPSGGPVGTEFLAADLTTNISRPAIAYNSQDREYLVVWQTDGTVPGNIWATRIRHDGVRIGNYEVAAGGGVTRSAPDVAYNLQDNDYYIVWQQDSGTRAEIWGKPFKPGGTAYGSRSLMTGSALKDCFEPAVAYATSTVGGDYRLVVVWERHVQGSLSSDIEGQVLTNGGASQGTNFIIHLGTTAASYSEPDIAYNQSRNEYLVVYTRDEANRDILGRILARNGALLGSVNEIGNHPKNEVAPAVAAMPTIPNYGGYFVTWELEYATGDGDIYGRTVPGTIAAGIGAQLGFLQIVSSGGQNQAAPAIAAADTNQRYLVAWAEAFAPPFEFLSGIRACEVTQGGSIVQPCQWAGGLISWQAAVASGSAGDFLAAWTGLDFSDVSIHGRLWGRRVYVPLVLRN